MKNGQQYLLEFKDEITTKCYAAEDTEVFSSAAFAKGQKLEVTFIKHKEQDYLFYSKSYGWFEIPDPSFDSILIEEYTPLRLEIKKAQLLTGIGQDRISFVVKTPTFEPDHYEVTFDCNVPRNKGSELLKNLGIHDYETINISVPKSNFSNRN